MRASVASCQLQALFLSMSLSLSLFSQTLHETYAFAPVGLGLGLRLGGDNCNQKLASVSRSPSKRAIIILNSVDTTSTNTDSTKRSSGSTSASSRTSKKIPFEKFDYTNQWYPVIWSQDLEINEPTKVTVFDVDYVVSKITNNQGEEEVIAMKDYCTHKGAALSEGRVTSTGHFQCAYHGWSFDGKSGECVEIPQIMKQNSKSATIPSRACSNATPAQIYQGMVWLFPGGGLEKALLAPSPPSNPDFGKLKLSTVIRDMPIDWPILVSNIADPDHGLFAHQDKSFDMYSASLEVGFESFDTKEENDGQSWSLKSQIDPMDKMLKVDQKYRDALGIDINKKKKRDKKSKKKDNKLSETLATFTYHAPTHVQMKRIHKQTNVTKFASVFYVCPVGVGRSRFMGAGLGKIHVPRWLNHLVVLNFLDQDTFLLATQQKEVMVREAQELRGLMEEHGVGREERAIEKLKQLRMSTRRNMFCLPSPTDKIAANIERFWDATLARSPNRVGHLLKLEESGAFLQTPLREVVLDRKTQTLDLCKDSQKTVRLCKRLQKASRWLLTTLSVVKLLSLQPSLSSSTSPGQRVLRLLKPILKISPLLAMGSFLCIVSYLAKRLENEFYYKYTDEFRKRDMKKIPKEIWVDR